MSSSPLKKGSGSEHQCVEHERYRRSRGACPLFQRAARIGRRIARGLSQFSRTWGLSRFSSDENGTVPFRTRQEEESLADRLRREASADRPEFSEGLHRRIHAAMQMHPAEAAALAQRADRRRRFRLVSAAVAAAALVVAVLVTWQTLFVGRGIEPVAEVSAPTPAPHREPAPRTRASVPPDDRDLAAIGELAEEASEQIVVLMEQTAGWPQFARLDYGATRVFRELSERVPLDALLALALADAPTEPRP